MIEFCSSVTETRCVNKTNTSMLTIPGGLLIAFEGIDGSGKTTMARRTTLALQKKGYSAVYLREPTDGPHGRRLREIMLSPEQRDPQREFELFLLDRQDDVRENIQPMLDTGGIVCIDRYYISSMAYQGALGLDPETIRRENEKFAPPPHLILWYTVTIEAALARINASRPEGANQFEKQEYLQRVLIQFQNMDFRQMIKINAMQQQSMVFDETWEKVTERISSHHAKGS